jgi:uncharacterized protein YcnI
MYVDLRLRALFPETPGDLYFPILQRCGDAEEAWIQVPGAGQSPDELDRPAGVVTIVEGEVEGH